jgi:tetrahydrodipicolinate N-succinyltransferase
MDAIEEGQSLHAQSDESDHDKVEKESDNIDQKKKKKKRIQSASIARFQVSLAQSPQPSVFFFG